MGDRICDCRGFSFAPGNEEVVAFCTPQHVIASELALSVKQR